ncbi:MAG TPA: M20/M25/M40 family metallo-hydrolase [Patescibacteria group bacterium]|nr:M20/M25/M40 family metallo-hydrolase [Patescibacteria group bacterium]
MTTNELITLTKRLIAIPSTSDNPAALAQVVDVLADIVAKVPNVTVERFERNGKPSFLAYRGSKRPKKFDILLNGHLDVVPAPKEQFNPVVKDGKLYGRGALDMKGTSSVLASVFCELVNSVPYNLGLQIVSDEEIGGYDGVSLQINEGVRANFVIMGEYANDRYTIYNAARGLCWAEIKFKGKTAHGGHLWNGTNAVMKAGDFAGAVLKRYPTPDKETWTTTASIANLYTPNEAYNRVPDTAILKIDFRFTQEDPVFQTRESLQTFVASIDPDAEIVNLATFEPAVQVEELNPYVQGLSAAMRAVSHHEPQYLGRPASSDGRHFALVQNDIVEFGLYGLDPHGDNEHVEIASFKEYRDTLRHFLQQPIPAQLKEQGEPTEQLHVELLRQLVEVPSVTGDQVANGKVLNFVSDFLAARGMHIKHFEQSGFRSFVATTKKDSTKPLVLLSAHSDVVPGKPEDFALTAKDGKLYGRGVMDMKSSLAAYMWLVDRLQGELDAYDFGIMVTSDEEFGGYEGVQMLVKQENYRPKVAIVPDGGENWRLETFAKGVQWIKLEATGKSGHASRPWEGDSAIRRLLGALREIEELVPANPAPEDTILSVGTIQGGTTANQIPTDASAMLDIRTGSAADHQRLLDSIAAICHEHDITETILVSDAPYTNDPEDPYIKQFLETAAHVTGALPATMSSFAVTDGRFFSAEGIPCIVIEPIAGGRHADPEWLSEESFGQFCMIIEQYVRKVAALHTAQQAKKDEIELLTKRLNTEGKPAYVWYATYGSGLSKQNFLKQVRGGQPAGSSRVFLGCTDPNEPLQDAFISLPYTLYFAGNCQPWGGGGHINIQPEPTPSAHTIARAYLITIEQFEEIAAQQNDRAIAQRLPFREAMRDGHATVGKGTGHYDELVYCGTKDHHPIFTLTAVTPELPYVAPSPVYAKLLCQGLSENTAMNQKTAVEYMLSMPGIAGNYKKQDLTELFKEVNPQK